MAKRFSIRKFGLLIAPVVLVVALVLWVSKPPEHPEISIDDEKISVTFQIDKPTGLEASAGYAGAFVLDIEMPYRQLDFTDIEMGDLRLDFTRCTLYLELQPPKTLQTSKSKSANQILWKNSTEGSLNLRSPFKNRRYPPGTLYLGSNGLFTPWDTRGAKPTFLVSRKWKIDRARLKAPNLAAMPRQPKVTVRSVTITKVFLFKNKFKGVPRGSVTGEVIFDLQGAAMNEATPFVYEFREHHFVPKNRVSYEMESGSKNILGTANTRVEAWTIFEDSLNVKMNVSGRASAGNRWPLAFEIEPFDFKSVKVGQKLKFKQFPGKVGQKLKFESFLVAPPK